MDIPTICRYCGGKVKLSNSSVIYDKDYGDTVYLCLSCNAYTKADKSNKPLGTLANRVLRLRRKATHEAFDGYCKRHQMTRTQGYHWLSNKLHLPRKATHIGLFELEMCEHVIDLCKK